MPILFLVMFGIIQYGLYFNDSLNTRQGVREGARLGVVGNFANEGTCTSADNMAKLACKTGLRIDALTGDAYIKVSAASWAKGSRSRLRAGEDRDARPAPDARQRLDLLPDPDVHREDDHVAQPAHRAVGDPADRRPGVALGVLTVSRRRDEHGAVAVMVSLVAVLLFVVAAMVVDLGLARDTKRQSQNAADAAALAAGNQLYDASGTVQFATAISEAKSYSLTNFGVAMSEWTTCTDTGALSYVPSASTPCISFNSSTAPTLVRVKSRSRR